MPVKREDDKHASDERDPRLAELDRSALERDRLFAAALIEKDRGSLESPGSDRSLGSRGHGDVVLRGQGLRVER